MSICLVTHKVQVRKMAEKRWGNTASISQKIDSFVCSSERHQRLARRLLKPKTAPTPGPSSPTRRPSPHGREHRLARPSCPRPPRACPPNE